MTEELARWCALANAVAYDLEGARNTCIQTSLALAEFLRIQGLQANVFRAEAKVHCTVHEIHSCHGSMAGSDGDGTRRPKSTGWRGHLAVSCGDHVLDPTIDQLETACGLAPVPAVFLKPDGWDVPPTDRPWQGGAWHHWSEGSVEVGHCHYRRQVGWKSKPAARQGNWMEIVYRMLERQP